MTRKERFGRQFVSGSSGGFSRDGRSETVNMAGREIPGGRFRSLMKSTFVGILLMCFVTGCAAKQAPSPYTYSQYSAANSSCSGDNAAVVAKVASFLLGLAINVGAEYVAFKTDNVDHGSNIFHMFKQMKKEIE